MSDVYLGLGSNLGDRPAMIELARADLAGLPGTSLIALSPLYETAPVGPIEQGPFLNAVAHVQTRLLPLALLRLMQKIEESTGRAAPADRQHGTPRTLDLDILLYDDLVMRSDQLIIPHPMMHQRWFVLKPLADLAPELQHPLIKRTMARLLKDVESQSGPAGRLWNP